MRAPALVTHSRIRTFAGCALALCAALAHAGTLRPSLLSHLESAPPDGYVRVIVELAAAADTKAMAAGALERRARAPQVVGGLRTFAERTQVPVLAQIAREQTVGGVRTVTPLWVINGLAITATPAAIRRLAARADVREVRLDAAIPPPHLRPSALSPTSADSAYNIDLIQAPDVWTLGPGYTGQGVVVGSFDTGVDGTHPDLAPRYRGNNAISWYDPYGEHASPFDNNGHGTHTTGTMVGGDLSGFNIGVAPGAKWIAAKAWDDTDNATESAFHQIFQWFLAPGGDAANAPDVVNSSWGLDPADCFPDFRADVQALRSAGIVPVFAAGNGGPDAGTVIAPGSYAESFAVGSTGGDEISSFSSEGPSPCDGTSIKPDISAPGEFVLSTFPGGQYMYLDGTSMATPHVSGAAALLLSIDHALSVSAVEDALSQGALDLGDPGPDNAFGAGRLNAFDSARIVLGVEKVGVIASTQKAFEAGTVPGVFTISRTGSTAAPQTFTYTVSGTATPVADYAPLSGTVTIPAGASSAMIVVAPVDDDEYELDETVIVTLDPNPDLILSPVSSTVTIVSDELPPDLVVMTMSAADNAGAGLPLAITDTTRNQGTGFAKASTTTYYLSTNTTLEATDVALGSRTVPFLAAGASDTATVTVTLPADAPVGTQYLIAKADSADAILESVENNNTYVRVVHIGPDLDIASLTVPPSAGAGDTITVTDTTRNTGGGTAAASNTRFYLSSDSVVDAADVMLGVRAVPTLAPGATSTGSVSLTIPPGTAGGTYYVLAKADADNTVSEINEGNNVLSAYLTLGSDLVVANLMVPDAGAGLPVTITDTTTNLGSGTAAASRTTYYLSTNNDVLDAADVALGSRVVPSLAGGASSTGSVTVTIPADTATGTFYVYAKADADGVVSETNENNNTSYRIIRVGPDLIVTSLAAPGAAGAGSSFTVSDVTRNQGGGAATATSTRYYLSINSTLDAGDIPLGARNVSALAAGASDSGSTTLTVPAGTPPGTYFLLAVADGNNALPETNETNNVFGTYINVGADLVISAFTAPDVGGAGLPITITDTTRNQGGAAPATTTTYYLSVNNNVLDAGDVVLGSRAVPALAAGAADTGSVTVTIPAGTPAGSFYLFAKADSADVTSETSETNNTSARSILIGPDLAIANLTVPPAAGQGSTISVTDTTKNQGGGGAAATTTRYYLSADYTVDASDVMLGSRSVAALAPGASSTGTVSLTIPAGTATGTYYILARADADDAVGETLENNNVVGMFITIGGDLVVTSLTVPDGGAGLPLVISDTTRNTGAGAVGASVTSYYLSTNNDVFDAADTLLGSRPVAALAPGASDTGSLTVTIPAGTPTGMFYVYAMADGANAVGEANEANNTAYRTIRIGPDLVVSSIAAPGAAGAGGSFTVSDVTRNQGGGSAPATNTRYYLSANATFDAGDVFLGSRSIAALAPGASDTGSATLTVPAGVASGLYFLLARADGDDALVETNETNNVYGVYITVGSDLTVATLSAPDVGGAGFTITLTDTTKNLGGAAPASTTAYYLSADSVIDASDTLLGSRVVPPLAAGASDTASVVVTIPPGTPPGTFYLIAQADSGNAVVETSETNNTYARTIRIGPDLTVASLSVPATAGAGSTISVTDTTRNLGAGATPPTVTRYYLSVNYAVDAGDIALGGRAVAALAPGASDSGTVSLTIPPGTTAGTYYLLAQADGDGVVAETTEGNNILGMYITIGGDLAVTSFSITSPAAPGSVITISDTTRNMGAGSVGASTTTYYLTINNDTLDAADIVLGSRAVPPLAGGASDSATITVTLPGGLPAGSFYVYAVADAAGVVAETQENNNSAYRLLRITP